jgi:putative phage-type endonuclease
MKSIHIPLTQSTPEWHSYRAEGIGASEASIIMGSNPFKTIEELWKEKTYDGVFVNSELNEYMKNGVDLEEKARNEFMKATGLKVEPRCYIHPRYSHVRVSLDGITDDEKIILEIKCPGRIQIHQKVIKGTIPSYYIAQLQYQLLAIPQAEVCAYWSYMKSFGGFMLELRRDEKYQKELLRRVNKFWKCVVNKTSPNPKDYTLFEL